MRRRSQGPVLAVTTRECSWQPDRGSLSAVREMSDEALQMLAFVKLMTKDDLPLPHGRRVQPADRGTFGLGRHPRAVRRGRMVRPSRIILPCSLVHPAPTVEHSCACRGWSFPTGGRHGGGGGPKFTAVAQSPESIWPLAMGGRRSHRTPFLRGRVIWAPEIYCHGENFTQVDFGGRRLPVRFVFIADWDEPDPGSKLILRIRNRGPRWLALDPLPVARLQGS